MPRKAAVDAHEFLVSEDHAGFVSQCWRCAFDQIEQTATSHRDVSTVLDMVRRPKSLRGPVVPPVEKCLESFEESALFAFSIVFVISSAPGSRPCSNTP